MQHPVNIEFTDFSVPASKVLPGLQGPMNLSWTRVQFPIPDGWEGSKKIQEWLEENCPGRWSTYSYQNPKSKSGENIMVIRFENKNDALMFKLKDGHKAWQE